MKINFDKASLKLLLIFFLMFFKNFGNYSFEQISDIVMGLNPAAFMENLFLYYNSYIMMKINGY